MRALKEEDRMSRIVMLACIMLAALSPAANAHTRHHASSRPHAWCGWYMSQHFGLHDKKLWQARAWAHLGRPARLAPGVVIVWPHHVGKVTAVDGRRVKVLSGNDGHRVRNRWRNIGHPIAFRQI